MLKSLLFDSFRSIKGPTKIDLSKITILCGPNSAGKSSVIRALEFFLALSSEKPWEADKGNAPISSTGEELPLQIGIEFTIENDIEESPRYDAHLNSLEGPFIVSDLEYFFNSLEGKLLKICVKFCQEPWNESPNFFEFYVDDELALRIDNDFTYIDPLFRPIEDATLLDDEIEQYVQGNLRVHKSLFGTNLFNNEYDNDTHSIDKLIWANDGEWSTTRGLFFRLFENKPRSLVNSLVETDTSSFNFLGGVEDEVIDDVLSSFYVKKVLKLNRNSLKKERKKILNGRSIKELKETLPRRLESDAANLRRFLEGLFLRLQSELRLSHVSGVRSIIDSKTPYHLATRDTIIGEFVFPGQNTHVKDYLRYWWGTYSKSSDKQSGNNEIYDLTQTGLANLMPSLGKYRFAPRVFQIDYIKDPTAYMKKGGVEDFIHHGLVDGALVFPYLENDSGSVVLDFRDVGSGVSFMFPIFSSLTLSKLSVIEQPELHLHPRAQCELGDVFAYAASNGRYSLVETHSEHMILRLSRRIRETSRSQLIPENLKLKAQDVLIYYFCPEADNWTSIRKIRLDEQGEFLDPWPDGFFGERSEELFS